MPELTERLVAVRERIERACARADRRPGSVLLVAVTKGFPPEAVRAAIGLGVTDFGENRIQEAEAKIAAVSPRPRWHMVGHLQTNKARRAVELFDEVQSVDSGHLAEELSKRADRAGREVPCLVEVNTSGEATKYGVAPAEAPALIRRCGDLSALRLHGLMTIGPLGGGPEGARAAFRTLRAIRDAAAREGLLAGDADLSMGMTEDFEIGIEEGATIIRLGTAIFGPRPAGAATVG
ncbi:MAG TPA: YggS family pyridoxal phosphate-dependent enzyme [Candidatus Eisenbacteria bacterium]